MKVLLIGATGNLGIRLVPALLSHHHTVSVYVRSPPKLEFLLPASVFSQLRIFKGDATDSSAMQRAIINSDCDAVVTAAGVAAVAPWAKSDLPTIFRAVADAVVLAGKERGRPLRTWFLGGQSVLYVPGTETYVSNYIPIFLEHRQNLALLRSLPANAVDWSMLCPQNMVPESTDFSLPTKPSARGKLVTSAGTPPNWRPSWVRHIPLLGRFLEIGMNASRYETTLEQNAEFIAEDLEVGGLESRWIGCTVGVVDAAK